MIIEWSYTQRYIGLGLITSQTGLRRIEPTGPGGAGKAPRKRKYDYWEVQDREEFEHIDDDDGIMKLAAIIVQLGILD